MKQLQHYIAWQILIGYGSLFCFIFILSATPGGFTEDELTYLLTTLSAILALYIAPLLKFIGKSLESADLATSDSKPKVNNLTLKLTKLIIPAHFIALGILILSKYLNIFSFQDMTKFLGFIETSFGTYMSFVLTALFKSEKP